MEGERVGLGTVVVFGSHHLHISQVFQCLVQGDDAGRLIAIVIGEQYFHAVDFR